MKKTSLVYLIAIMCIIVLSDIAAAAGLPEVSGWQSSALRITPFDTISGNRGSWQERSYITDSGTRVLAVWTEGAGEKGWAPSSENISADDGLMGSGSVCKTTIIDGERAFLESHPVTGLSISVKISGKGTLTLESANASEKELLIAATELTLLIK